MNEDRLVKVYKTEVKDKRSNGRSRRKWMDGVSVRYNWEGRSMHLGELE